MIVYHGSCERITRPVLACNAMNVELSAVSSDLVGSMIGSVLMVVINRVYYNKRMELFVN